LGKGGVRLKSAREKTHPQGKKKKKSRPGIVAEQGVLKKEVRGKEIVALRSNGKRRKEKHLKSGETKSTPTDEKKLISYTIIGTHSSWPEGKKKEETTHGGKKGGKKRESEMRKNGRSKRILEGIT